MATDLRLTFCKYLKLVVGIGNNFQGYAKLNATWLVAAKWFTWLYTAKMEGWWHENELCMRRWCFVSLTLA